MPRALSIASPAFYHKAVAVVFFWETYQTSRSVQKLAGIWLITSYTCCLHSTPLIHLGQVVMFSFRDTIATTCAPLSHSLPPSFPSSLPAFSRQLCHCSSLPVSHPQPVTSFTYAFVTYIPSSHSSFLHSFELPTALSVCFRAPRQACRSALIPAGITASLHTCIHVSPFVTPSLRRFVTP